MGKGSQTPKIVDKEGAKSSDRDDKLDSLRGKKQGAVRPVGGKN